MTIFPRRGLGRAMALWLPAAAAAALFVSPRATAQEAPPAPAAGTASNYFNPSISVIGNFLAVGGENEVENLPNASLRESEVSLSAVVDPYARADFYLAFGEEGVEIEEGYITFTSLPGDLLLKVGRIKPSFGKVNTLHLHALPWPDEPLPLVNLLGEEGWAGSGASVARIFPLPGETFSELTLQAVRADAEGLFESDERSELAWNARYRVFRDLTEASNLDVGLSYARGPNGDLADATQLAGVDFVYRWKPLVTAGQRSFTVRGELYGRRGEAPFDEENPGEPTGSEDALGWYLSADYQFARRWVVGARIESSDRADDPSVRDDGQALLLTFSPTEFSQVRGELRRRTYADSYEATEFLLQLQFSIGAHGAHPF